jgi:HAD superfamily hydrolase (TIGR01490 family)
MAGPHVRLAPRPPVVSAVPSGGGLAIFDLDRTLVPGSSLALVGRELVRRGVVRRRAVAAELAAGAVFARRGLGEARSEQVCRRLLGLARGLDRELLLGVLRDAAPEIVGRVYGGGRFLIDRHLLAGDFCVIVSSSPQELVDQVAASLGIHRAVGTRAEVARGCYTGRLERPFCHGPAKLTRLADELGRVDLSHATAYSDAASDLPLLEACGHPVAVNPDRGLTAAAKRNGWPVLRLT